MWAHLSVYCIYGGLSACLSDLSLYISTNAMTMGRWRAHCAFTHTHYTGATYWWGHLQQPQQSCHLQTFMLLSNICDYYTSGFTIHCVKTYYKLHLKYAATYEEGICTDCHHCKRAILLAQSNIKEVGMYMSGRYSLALGHMAANFSLQYNHLDLTKSSTSIKPCFIHYTAPLPLYPESNKFIKKKLG